MQKCAYEGKSDARIEDRVTNDVYQTLVAERPQDAEALAAEDADNSREQQLPSHRILRPRSIRGRHCKLRYYPRTAVCRHMATARQQITTKVQFRDLSLNFDKNDSRNG